MASYGMTAKMFEDVLPLDAPLQTVTIRNHVLKITERLEEAFGDEQGCYIEGCPPGLGEFPMPDVPLTVGIDGGYVKAQGMKQGWFEVIAGKSILAFRRDMVLLRHLCASLGESRLSPTSGQGFWVIILCAGKSRPLRFQARARSMAVVESKLAIYRGGARSLPSQDAAEGEGGEQHFKVHRDRIINPLARHIDHFAEQGDACGIAHHPGPRDRKRAAMQELPHDPQHRPHDNHHDSELPG